MPQLAEIVRIPALHLELLVAGQSPRPVRWVTTSELADPTPYLEGGELLLTTGLIPHDWPRYVEQVTAAGVAALGFGIGLSHSAVPAELVGAAESAGLPLVLVPESTPFIAIGKALARLIAEEERAATSASLALQQELTRAIGRHDGPRRVLKILARTTGGEAGLVDAAGRALSPARFRVGAAADRALALLRADERGRAVTEVDASGTTVVQPVGSARSDVFLVLVTPGPLDDVGRAGLATTVALLGLDAERRRASEDTELRLRDCATRLLLRGETTACRSVAALLRAAPVLPERVRVLQAAAAPPGAQARLAHEHPQVLTAAAAPGRLTAVVTPDAAPAIEGLLAGLGCRVGTGSAVPLGQAGRSAAAAATALAATDDRSPVARWDERFRSGVRAALGDDAAAVLSSHILGPLGEDPELLRTLRAYLTHLGRWQPTAAELGIHRNTLGKRLRRIAAATGRDVDSAAGRADLWIALEAAQIPE